MPFFPYITIERWARSSTKRQGRLSNHIPAWYIRKLSRAKLINSLRHVYRNSPAQRKAWNDAGIKSGDLRGAEVLQHIPFTTGSELAERTDDYICVAPEELIHVLTTSSATGLKKTIYLTGDDFDHQVRTIGAHLRRFPGANKVAVMFLVHDPTWSVGTVIRQGVAEAGMLGFLSGVHRSVDEHIELIKEYGVNRLITSPAHLGRLTVEASEDVGKLGIRYIHLGTQPWTEEFRRQMEQTWGAKLIDGYGSNECVCAIASECLYGEGLHVAEADLWMEIIDPRSGKAVADGQEGEVAVTTLSRRGMPLVRYRTGDISHLMSNGRCCSCGLGFRKMGRVRGRVDDMLIIGAGHNVYPGELDRAILSVPGISDYRLVVRRDGFKDILDLTVEAKNQGEELKNAARRALMGMEDIEISCRVSRTLSLGEIEIVAPGSLTKDRPKSIRIVDQRGSGQD